MNQMNQHNNRREFLRKCTNAAAGLGCLSLGIKAQSVVMTHPLQDNPETHNMLVVGEQTVFLSHLPMFDGVNAGKTDFVSPHRYQVILEATFTEGTNNLTEVYMADRKSHPTERMYTINPALFLLPDLDPKGKALLSFRGNTVFRGHLERDSHPIIGFKLPQPEQPPAGGVFDVNITRVIHFQKFVPGAKPTELQYILFGKGPELFLAHFIAQPPDFDQIISVKVTGQQLKDDELSNGLILGFPKRPNRANRRLKQKQKTSGLLQIPGSDSKSVQVEAVREFYFEEGELRVPPTFSPTLEEKKSGFLE